MKKKFKQTQDRRIADLNIAFTMPSTPMSSMLSDERKKDQMQRSTAQVLRRLITTSATSHS